MIGVDYSLNRPVFVIGGFAFFRRYNDDWNCTLFYSDTIYNGNISWINTLSKKSLLSLLDLIKSKNLTAINKEDILSCIN